MAGRSFVGKIQDSAKSTHLGFKCSAVLGFLKRVLSELRQCPFFEGLRFISCSCGRLSPRSIQSPEVVLGLESEFDLFIMETKLF